MRGGIPTLAMAFLLVAPAADAFEAQGVDIIGLRLGIPEAEAVTILGRQGYPVTRDRDALLARTRDGNLTIDLANGQVHEIRYVFTDRGVGGPDTIPAAVLDRFGPPNQPNPMTWCQVSVRDGKCLPRAAALIFFPETLTLVLRAGNRGPR